MIRFYTDEREGEKNTIISGTRPGSVQIVNVNINHVKKTLNEETIFVRIQIRFHISVKVK